MERKRVRVMRKEFPRQQEEIHNSSFMAPSAMLISQAKNEGCWKTGNNGNRKCGELI